MIKKINNLYNKYNELVNYIIVGALTTVVSLLSFFLLRTYILVNNTQIDIQSSNVISWVLAVIFAFFTNKKYVFKSKTKGKEGLKEVINFFLARVTTLFIEIFFMWIFTCLIRIDDKISKLIIQVIVLILNYVFSKIFVFKINIDL